MTARSMTLRKQLHTREIVVPAALGIGLGLAAYIPDMLDDAAAPYANPFFSSGFAWGFIALLAGYLTRRERASIAVGGATLTFAVITYYCLILFVNQRWYVDALNSEDGLASSAGLDSVARSIAFWVFGAVVGGAIMGWLGWASRETSARRSSAVLGVILGLLTGEGLFTVTYFGFFYLGPVDAFYLSKLIPAIVQIMLGVIAVVLTAIVGKQPTAWRLTAGVGAVSVVVNVMLWYAVFSVRMGL